MKGVLDNIMVAIILQYINVSNNTLNALNLHNVIGQLYHKTGKKHQI